ncbi:hypothetical protein JTB14_003509 [Gonioctena quinquepunctata]|nr:hypothetical protein JTB14_003509 [Gonioctena quinquepunctata]
MSNKWKKIDISETQSSEEEEEEEEDTECPFCRETLSKDNSVEGWIKCCVCQKWGHEACAGLDSDDPDEFTCDLCT